MKDSLQIATIARLLETGIIKKNARNDFLIRRFETERLIDPSGRMNEWKARSQAGESFEAKLAALLPTWRDDFLFLRAINRNPFDPRDIESLPALRRRVTAIGLINRRNWNAASGLSPKHQSRVQSNAFLTKDWGLRFRPNKGLQGRVSGELVNFSAIASVLTECFIPERGWMELDGFSDILPTAIVTCENLGAYVDFPSHDSLMIIYSPGADIEPATKLLSMLPEVLWVHFGDIDPEGIEIAENIARETGRDLNVYIPSFASEYLPGRPVKTPWSSSPENPIFAELRKEKKRLFQEVFMLDDRLLQDFIVGVERREF